MSSEDNQDPEDETGGSQFVAALEEFILELIDERLLEHGLISPDDPEPEPVGYGQAGYGEGPYGGEPAES